MYKYLDKNQNKHISVAVRRANSKRIGGKETTTDILLRQFISAAIRLSHSAPITKHSQLLGNIHDNPELAK